MKKISAVIFDMDGTIVNTEPLWVEATRLLLTRRNVAVTKQLQQEINLRVRGLSVPNIMLTLKNMFNLEEEVSALVQEETQLAHSLYETNLAFMDGFEQFHAELKANNIKCAIATNGSDAAIAKTDRILQLERFFGEHIYGISSVQGVSKPSPDIFLYAAQQLEADPSQCVVIEDSPPGIQAAKAARMYCVGINGTGSSEFTQGANHVVKNFHELNVQTLGNVHPDVPSLTE